MANSLAHLPILGSGLGYRGQIKEGILAHKDGIDFLEIITDQFITRPGRIRELHELKEHFPLIAHGVELSIGSATEPNPAYLAQIKHISDLVDSPYYSEHLCMTRSPGINLGHLSPIWFNEDVLTQTIRNVNIVQETLQRPLVLENVTYLIDVPNSNLSQTQFFNHLVAETGCGVLLDVTNVFINSVNHGFDGVTFLEEMPLEQVVQVHIAGGYWRSGRVIDGHSHPVQEETWNLLNELTQRTQVNGIILEHDAQFPEVSNLVKQVKKAQTFMQNYV